MKFTIKELAESKEKREELKDYLANKVHTAEKLEEAAFKPFQLSIPNVNQAHKLWIDCQSSVHDLMILRVLAETDEDELEEKLESLYSYIEKAKAMEKEDAHKLGFEQGFVYGRQIYAIITDNLMEKHGLMDIIRPLSEEAKVLKDIDKKAGTDLKSREEYEELGEDIAKEKARVHKEDIDKRQAREKKLGVVHDAGLDGNWVFTTEQLDTLEAKVAEGKSIKEAMAGLGKEELRN